MGDNKMLNFIRDVLKNIPQDWLDLTTHRLDIYDEKLAKTQFLEKFESLYNVNNSRQSALSQLPTAFDYIRLGHPLSCLLEWVIANLNNLNPENVISFSSKTMPILAILRKNLLDDKNTQILYTDELPASFDVDVLKRIYGYEFQLKKIKKQDEISEFDGSTIFISQHVISPPNWHLGPVDSNHNIDFFISVYDGSAQTAYGLGSVVLINNGISHQEIANNENYISAIQHVRRRETIAMTPANCHKALMDLIDSSLDNQSCVVTDSNKTVVIELIKEITGTIAKPLLSSCGLSIQYAITMGLIHDALENHKDKAIKIVVPPNCYGGTNDQARRVAACIDNVEVVDLPVDGDNDMVQSIDTVLEKIAFADAIPLIIAEIPTNPRVEVPDLAGLKDVLTKERKTKSGQIAVDPVFILDQTFCPNVHFLGKDDILSSVRTISYVSGSKFPSGGLCTAGYCVVNSKAEALMEKVELHLMLCDNEATNFQIGILAKQMPTMAKRIHDAYKNTREFVDYITEVLPEAKINFVSEELAKQGFTPSVFSLDLPTLGDSDEEKESYKRKLNYQLINLMIKEIPNESKFCVSYGQVKGSYWTIPATSTQGTTKEGDKDYIVRVSLSPNMDVDLHKKVFLEFVNQI